MDDAKSPLARGGRSLDLALDPRLCPASPGTVARSRYPVALAETALSGENHACACAPSLFVTASETRKSSIGTKTLWQVAGTPERETISPQLNGYQRSNSLPNALHTPSMLILLAASLAASAFLLVKMQAMDMF